MNKTKGVTMAVKQKKKGCWIDYGWLLLVQPKKEVQEFLYKLFHHVIIDVLFLKSNLLYKTNTKKIYF